MGPVTMLVRTDPFDRASPVGARKTWAVTGVDGSGRVAVPRPTFVHVIQRTSTFVWSTGELKATVRTFEPAVTPAVDRAAPPGNKGATPFKSVRTAAHPEISNPGGMLLNATLTSTPPGNTAPVSNCAADLKRSG